MTSGKPNSSPIKNCEECMVLFKYKPSVEKKGHARFCSTICQRQWQSESRVGDVHSYWKGDSVGYCALHSWVSRKLGKPKKCFNCERDNLETYNIHWANISGNYKRNLGDWVRLCAKCHKNYDLGNIKLNLQGAQ